LYEIYKRTIRGYFKRRKCDTYRGLYKKRIYFPDFYIKSTNTIVEIKSEWTLQLTTCRLSSKAEAVIKEGYKYEVLVYGSNKKCTRAISF
jgi:predicted nuclease of restriction endonuclease-like RecB superfamily